MNPKELKEYLSTIPKKKKNQIPLIQDSLSANEPDHIVISNDHVSNSPPVTSTAPVVPILKSASKHTQVINTITSLTTGYITILGFELSRSTMILLCLFLAILMTCYIFSRKKYVAENIEIPIANEVSFSDQSNMKKKNKLNEINKKDKKDKNNKSNKKVKKTAK